MIFISSGGHDGYIPHSEEVGSCRSKNEECSGDNWHGVMGLECSVGTPKR